jgi:hypothetical protein
MRLQVDVGRHGGADAARAACDRGAAVHVVDLHDGGVRVVHGGGGFHVLRVESAREPQGTEFG